ncbi:MAG: Ppx/GppA family phosphatase [Alphaproteobacteria bacterium]|nr:Ppx/GppA family phosphatase [Alphaproteobacteria bacterium]
MFAALDLGTNSCRLLVARPAREGFEVVDAFSRIVRLGEGVGASGRLQEAAMARTIKALRVCAAKMRERNVTRWRNVATEACRRAANGDDFLARVRAETGLVLDVITAEEEAQLALSGCASLLDRARSQALVFDIGGGSTELLWLNLAGAGAPQVLAGASFPCGVVLLAEHYGGRDVADETYAAMVADVMRTLDPFGAASDIGTAARAGQLHLLGTSGTVTTLAAIHLGLARYDRAKVDGMWLTADQVVAVSRQLVAMDFAERVRHPCIQRGRADLVIAGCAILDAILRLWPAGHVRVADRGLRDGVLISLMQAADAEVRGALAR